MDANRVVSLQLALNRNQRALHTALDENEQLRRANVLGTRVPQALWPSLLIKAGSTQP